MLELAEMEERIQADMQCVQYMCSVYSSSPNSYHKNKDRKSGFLALTDFQGRWHNAVV